MSYRRFVCVSKWVAGSQRIVYGGSRMLSPINRRESASELDSWTAYSRAPTGGSWRQLAPRPPQPTYSRRCCYCCCCCCGGQILPVFNNVGRFLSSPVRSLLPRFTATTTSPFLPTSIPPVHLYIYLRHRSVARFIVAGRLVASGPFSQMTLYVCTVDIRLRRHVHAQFSSSSACSSSLSKSHSTNWIIPL